MWISDLAKALQKGIRQIDPIVDLSILPTTEAFDVVHGKAFGKTLKMYVMDSCVVGNGGNLRGVEKTNDTVALYMEQSLVAVLAEAAHPKDPVIGIDDLNIGKAKIRIISVDETVIPSADGEGTDPVAAANVDLHSVIGHKQVAAPFHDLMGGVVKQILLIKGQMLFRRQIVEEIPGINVDRRRQIHTVIPKIQKCNDFGKGQNQSPAKNLQILDPEGFPVRQDFFSLQIGLVSPCLGRIAAQ